jgi:putative DNA primase/helicase
LMISGPTPAFLIQKPSPGTGATLLANVISLIALGRPAMLEVAKTDGDEWRKSITASLLGGSSMIVFDNVHAEIKDQSIAAAITAETWSDRMLGKSQKVALPNTALWLFTGNNVTFSSELARRLVMVRLDAGLVDPTKDRVYKHADLQKWVKANRTALVGAILTLVQAWIAAGQPVAKGASRLASFEDWSAVIGGILSFAEIPGFLQDRDTIKTGITDEDDAVQQLVQLMHDVFGLQPARVGRLDWNSNARSTDAQSEFLDPEPPAHLAQLVLDHSDRLSFWWLSQPKEKWGNRIGRELSPHVDRVFELKTESGPAQFKLHKHKTENGYMPIPIAPPHLCAI